MLKTEPILLKWEGPEFDDHSFAKVNRTICRYLTNNESISLQPGSFDPKQIQSNPNLRVDVTVRHQWPPDWMVPDSKYWVCMQPWEFGAIPRQWLIPMKYRVDQIWVYSNYNKECYIRCGIPENKIKVIPLGVDESVYHYDVQPIKTEDDAFRFLFVGGTISRKGIDTLLQVYLQEFSAEEDVCLVIKDFGTDSVYQGLTYEKQIAEAASNSDNPRIMYLNKHYSEQHLAELYKTCDCLVHPYRGEGFGLPIIEAMACGTPAIIPAMGPSQDFCDADTAFLLPCEEEILEQKRIGDMELVDNPWWLKIDQSELQKMMRFVYENRSAVKEKGRKASQKIVSSFTWKQTARIVSDTLGQLIRTEPYSKQSNKDSIELEMLRALGLYLQNRFAESAALFLKIVTAFPEERIARYHLSLAYMQQGDYKSAIQHLTQLTDSMNDESELFQAETWSTLGICYSKLQSFHSAIDAFHKAAQINPSLSRQREIFCLKYGVEKTYELLGTLYQELGNRYAEMSNDFRAKEMYLKALEYKEDHSVVMKSLSDVNERIRNMRNIVSKNTAYEVLWQCPLFNASGYSEEQKHFLDGLRPYPLRVKTVPMDVVPSPEHSPSNMKSYMLELQNQRLELPLIHYQAAPAYQFSMPVAPISIGRTMFETDTLPSSWVQILNEMSEVWVPSEFNRETFASAGVKPERIQIIPGTLDENKYNPINAQPYPIKGPGSFKFLSVFDWSIRKGWDILLRAYFEAFSPNDDVSLILKISKLHEPNIKPYSIIRDIASKSGLSKIPHVQILQESISEEEMVNLYAAADCFVLPSRGEGWGRPYMEAMAMEIPVIGTKWSGQQAFMTEENSYPIEIERLVPVDAGMPAHFHGHRWAEPSADHLKVLMREVYDHPEEAKRKGVKARKDLFPRFSKHTIGQQIYQRMDELVKVYYS